MPRTKDPRKQKRPPTSKKRDINIGRKGSTNSAPERGRVEDQAIQLLIKKTITAMLSGMSEEERAAYFLSMPPSVQAQLINQFVPKIKESDVQLVESHISLLKAYERLPNVEDVTERARILTIELRKMISKWRVNEFLLNKMFPTKDAKFNQIRTRRGIRQRTLRIIRAVYSDAQAWMDSKKEQFIPLERWKDVVDQVWRDYPEAIETEPIRMDPGDRIIAIAEGRTKHEPKPEAPAKSKVTF